jgi:hypothetical protein
MKTETGWNRVNSSYEISKRKERETDFGKDGW